MAEAVVGVQSFGEPGIDFAKQVEQYGAAGRCDPPLAQPALQYVGVGFKLNEAETPAQSVVHQRQTAVG